MRKERFDTQTWRAELPAWCQRSLGARPERTLFEGGWHCAAVGLHLEDGRDVVVKIRLADDRVGGCDRVHRHLHAKGFPCPEPLAAPRLLGRYVASAERYVAGGDDLPDGPDRMERMAGVLARLVKTMPAVVDVPSLDPPPTWAWWNHSGRRLWPPVSEGHVDLNAHAEPSWLVDITTRVRTRLMNSTLPAVIGHINWTAQHVRWLKGELHVVHDWNSVCSLPEAAIAGVAAVMFAATADSAGASLAETSDFLGAYAIARGPMWTLDEQEVAWAAGLWTMAYHAKGETFDNVMGPASALLLSQRDERLRRANA